MNKYIGLLLTALSLQLHADTILVFGGKTGWVGQKVVHSFQETGHTVIHSESRLEDAQGIEEEIKRHKPDRIFNAAGITGKPNVDWCESNKVTTFNGNVLGPKVLADVARKYNIHVTQISTGCLYEYNEAHPMYSGIGFTEEEKPNFAGSFYSRTKILMEELLADYPNVLILRIKMPISTELDKGFVGKIRSFKKVVNIPNSLTILDDLLPIAVDMSLKETIGLFNFVNPGALSHNQVLDLYKDHIDPTFTYENFTVEEQAKILKVPRANAELSAAKLLKLYPNIPHVNESLPRLFDQIKNGLTR